MKRIGLQMTVLTVMGLAFLLVWGFHPNLAYAGSGLTVSPASPKPGTTIEVKGEGIWKDQNIVIQLTSNEVDLELGQVKGDSTGNFASNLTIPANLKPGIYQLVAKSQQTTASFQLNLTEGYTEPGSSASQLDVRPQTFSDPTNPGHAPGHPKQSALGPILLGILVAATVFLGMLIGIKLYVKRSGQQRTNSPAAK